MRVSVCRRSQKQKLDDTPELYTTIYDVVENTLKMCVRFLLAYIKKFANIINFF